MSRGKEKQHAPAHPESSQPAAQPKPEPVSGVPAAADVAAAAGAAPAAPLPLEQEQAQQLAKLQDQLLRLGADFDNFRKRTLKEKNEIHEIAAADLMLELLPVLDHLQLGIQAAAAHKTIQDGLRLIFDQLLGVLGKFGLVPFDVEKQVFDPARCEAIGHLASEQVPEGVVLAQTRRGYLLRQRLLRPAQVVVSTGPAAGAGKKTELLPPETPAAAED